MIASTHYEKIISKLPDPFIKNQTPYSQNDFPKFVRMACSSFLPLTSSLRVCKVIVLGDVSVGKTSLIKRFCHQVFNRNYKATIGVDFEMEEFDILKVPLNLQIWDTAGQERFKCIAAAYYRSTHAIITVFDLTKPSTLKHCMTWMAEALESNLDVPLKFLVGTKRDLLNENEYNQMEAKALDLAGLMGAEYWAVSAKSGAEVTPMFRRVAALCFEQSVKSSLEMSEESSRVTLGVLSGQHPKNSQVKNMNCEGKMLSCSRQ